MKKTFSFSMYRLFPPLLLTGAILVVLGILFIILSPSCIPRYPPSENKAELERIRKELPLAEARWESHNITNYGIDVIGVNHPGMCADFSGDDIRPLHLEIRQGEIAFEGDSQIAALKPCDIHKFLPPEVFDTIRSQLANADPDAMHLQVEFDPEYGFVSSYYLTANNRIADANIRYTFSNFHPESP